MTKFNLAFTALVLAIPAVPAQAQLLGGVGGAVGGMVNGAVGGSGSLTGSLGSLGNVNGTLGSVTNSVADRKSVV